ncbi:DUF3429 domain-containing protein [Jiella sp. M17.18]|uniref:DUF3429 domain-containing protein n=1 Tax=Jiella sp. M17.18 TaxID=3234247 RepID=UPI0034DE6894
MTTGNFDPAAQDAALDATDPPAAPARRRDPVRTAWVLGLGGLVPFVLMAAVIGWAGTDFIAYGRLVLAFSGYSATILAFLGGIRWGFSLLPQHRRRGTLILSVLPSLAGWFILFVPSPWMFAGFAAAFALQGTWDVVSARRGHLPAWFGRLRLVLTIVVVICQLVAFAATFRA